ncbi:helix-turn-helix domain-containing protein [Corallococcus soli]
MPRQRQALQQVAEHVPGRERLRALVVLLSAEGHSASHIALTLGLAERTVHQCRRRWRQGGLASLTDAPRSGRPARADAAYERLLEKTVQRDPRRLGYAFARWTAPHLAEYLRQHTGTALSPRWVRGLLKARGFVWRQAKRTTRYLQ